jgi:peptidyl-prolyl cis-trans isomerase C
MAAALAALSVCGVGTAQVQKPPSAPRPVAVVYGAPISAAELEGVLKMTGPATVHLSPSQQRQRKLEALTLLIDNVLMRRFLEKKTPPVSPAEITRRMSEMEAGLKAQGKTVAEFCHDTNQTEAQLKTSLADHLRWAAYVQQNVSDVMLEHYYRDNKDFFDQVTVRASHIVLRVSPGASALEKAEARAKLEKIRQVLVSDPRADFAEYARKHSQDARAAKGGDLGPPFPRKWAFDESFSRAAFSTKEGGISDVVQTDYGLHLIKVHQRIPGKPSDFSKIKEAVREFCAEDCRQAILAREREEARKDNQVTIDLP